MPDGGIPDWVARSLTRSILEQAILDGEIDPSGKSEKELRREFEAYMRGLTVAAQDDRLAIKMGVDHRGGLLAEAKRFRVEGDNEVACLLYSTWVEHWANHTVMVGCRRAGLREEEISEVIRHTRLEAKFGWVLPLLSLPRISPKHRAALQRLADLRNAFVHYKWVAHDDASSDQLARRVRAALDPIDATVEYLRKYERRNLLMNTSAVVNRYVRDST